MRRSPIVLGATIAGTAGVLAFHPPTPAVQTATATPRPTTSSAPAPAASSGSAGGSGSGSAKRSTVSGTATGAAVATQYGDAQVRVTVTDGKIVKVEALQLQGNDQHSVEISSSAEPVLQQEVLTQQTADVDAVGGATFTSASYLQSLQSALDKLGFKAPDGSRATTQVPQGGGGPGH
jgi:uncharacterized protein with FMN-binding domain